MFEYIEKDIHAISEAMRRGEITAVDLVKSYLKRIELYDKQGPYLNSIIALNPQALEDARVLDEERKANNIRSVLHGIPIVIKDNIDVVNMPTTAGCTVLQNCRPVKDAFVVTKLRQAGAVILAKVNLTEFARHGVSVSSLGGQTRNPYDLTRTPGGSSGGTGAAVAANFAVAGLGTDTVNSVRSPSSACNLVGIRPTTGLLSRSGTVPCALITQDTVGVLARTVSDAVILLDVCAGYDSEDLKTAETIKMKKDSYVPYLDAQGVSGKRIGSLRNIFGCDPEILEIMKNAENTLRRLGAEIVPLEIPEFDTALVFKTCDVQLFETKPYLNAYFQSIPNCSVKDIEELVGSGKLHTSIVDDMTQCARIEDPLQQMEYFKRLNLIAEKRSLAYYTMAEHQLDAFLYPHQQILTEPIINQSQNGRNGVLASVLGFPAIVLPGGFTRPTEHATQGVPVGVEFMARPYDEAALIEIAFGFEQKTRYRIPPASTP